MKASTESLYEPVSQPKKRIYLNFISAILALTIIALPSFLSFASYKNNVAIRKMENFQESNLVILLYRYLVTFPGSLLGQLNF